MASIYIQQRSAGGFRIRVRIKGRDHYELHHGSPESAERAGVLFLARIEGKGGLPTSQATPLGGWMQTYLGTLSLEARTRERYAEIARIHLGDLARRRLNSLTVGDALDWQRALTAKGLGPATVRYAFRLVRASLAEAARLAILPANPFQAVRAPKARRTEQRVPHPSSFPLIAAQAGDKAGDLLAVALATGARRGELLALTFADIDWQAGSMTIARALELLADGSVNVKAPKTAAGARTIALAPLAMDILRRRKAEAGAGALAAGARLADLPIFPGDAPAAWWNPRAAGKACARILRRHGIDGTLHSLRHAHATALLAGRANPRMVQRRLGHGDLTTTLSIYGHALPQDDEAGAAMIGATMEGLRA